MIKHYKTVLREKLGKEIENYSDADVNSAAQMLFDIDVMQGDLSAQGFDYGKQEVFENHFLPYYKQDNFIGLVAAGISAVGMVAKALIDRKTQRENAEAAQSISETNKDAAEINAQAAEYEAMMQEKQEAIAAQQAELQRIKMLEAAELERAEKEAEKEQKEKLMYAGIGILALAIILLLIFK